jgi:F0F1-type ATP synthase assembly protein I
MAKGAGDGGRSPYVVAAVYGAAGVQLALSVVAGLFVGDYLDDRFATGPWLSVAGLVLGFVGGMVNLIRIVKGADAGGGRPS